MKPMLASKWVQKNEAMFPFWAQPKLDGIRVLIGEDGYAYTRSLKQVRNEEFQSMVRLNKDVLAGLDAEVVVGPATAKDCYRRTSSAVMSFQNPDIVDVKLWIFDVWNHSGNYDERYGEIIERSHLFPPWAEILPCSLLSDMKMLESYQDLKLDEGHEGVILRRRDTTYKKGRGTPTKGELIKLKKFADDEGVIVAVHEEMHNSNPATINALGHTEHSGHKEGLIGKNTLGAVEVKLGPEWPSETVRIGSGFDAAQREDLWKDRDNLIGRTVKFKYFEIGVKDAPRFPIFLGFRDVDDMETNQGDLF